MRARKENKSSFLVCLVGAEHKLNDTPVATQGDRLPSINVERDATDTFETKKSELAPAAMVPPRRADHRALCHLMHALRPAQR